MTKEEAVSIARQEIDFEPERVSVRFIPRGVPTQETWAVSFGTVAADGRLERVTVVVVDAETGEVVEVRRAT